MKYLSSIGTIHCLNIVKAYDLGSSYSKFKSFIFNFSNSRRIVLNIPTLSISKGDCVGILGKNGAGKSTLLKLISGVLQPNMGTIKVNGSVSSILELGVGFSPILTGRQNCIEFLRLHNINESIIESKITFIEDFSSIGIYFDEQLSSYSTGMSARLAFSAAISLNCDILIIDEVLSVGDARFQAKCFDYFNSIIGKKTILLVTHNHDLVSRLCNKAAILDGGILTNYGPAKTIVDIYEKSLYIPVISRETPKLSAQSTNQNQFYNKFEHQECSSLYKARILGFNISGLSSTSSINTNDRISIELLLDFLDLEYSYNFGLAIYSRDGLKLTGFNYFSINNKFYKANNKTANIKFSFNLPLIPGDYFIDAGVSIIENDEKIMCNLRKRYIHIVISGDFVCDTIIHTLPSTSIQ
jgi:ABC-type polysaccharide/polyol phosphate transport system ATPase subunit